MSATLEPGTGNCQQRQAKFEELRARFEKAPNPIHDHMVRLMLAFCGGLFAGGDDVAEILDNLDLERWFRLPKSHERRIHGHRHAGVRIVQEGPTLVLVLDAHHAHPRPSLPRTSCRTEAPQSPSASVRRWIAVRSCEKHDPRKNEKNS